MEAGYVVIIVVYLIQLITTLFLMPIDGKWGVVAILFLLMACVLQWFGRKYVIKK